MDEIMLRIDNVLKKYKLGQIGGTTLRDELQRKMAKIKGQEDPTRKIGAKNYDQGETFMALNGVSFDVKKGERVGIIGHNGAGKSTLLKLISRVTAPTGGKIQMNGRVASMLEVGTGFHPELTGRENIYMNGAILGMTKKEIDTKMEDIIEFSEVRQFIDTPVKRYSSGMYVKLAFSVAANLDSEIMIMDEVLAVGDMAFQKKCLDKMNDVSKSQGRTILYVSHNMNTIRQLCDRVVVLDHGKVIFDGDVEKGIQLYMGTDMSKELPTTYNLESLRRNFGFGEKVVIKEFTFANVEQPIYEVGDLIDCKIVVYSKIDISNARILIPVKDMNYTKVCLVRSEEFALKANRETTLLVQLKTEFLSDDKYCLDVAIIQISDEGNFLTYDDPGEKLILQLSNNYAHGMEWHKEYWGSIMLPEVKVYEN